MALSFWMVRLAHTNERQDRHDDDDKADEVDDGVHARPPTGITAGKRRVAREGCSTAGCFVAQAADICDLSAAALGQALLRAPAPGVVNPTGDA
ncbi:hypothetical protein [Reyranella sp.]|uniref:hypothetical protein n=1 Tax=Reyranella sp. TaxID=1929291 RepID=UPI002F953888